jgi:glutamate carboxypeptidase
MITGGTAPNTVPAAASVTLDVRASSRAAQETVHAALHALAGDRAGVGVDVVGCPSRPPLPPDRTDELFAMYVATARQFDDEVAGMAVGGASDGNLCADEGALTLDGLGAIGGHAHAEGEFVDVAKTLSRMHVTRAFLERLLAEGVPQAS